MRVRDVPVHGGCPPHQHSTTWLELEKTTLQKDTFLYWLPENHHDVKRAFFIGEEPIRGQCLFHKLNTVAVCESRMRNKFGCALSPVRVGPIEAIENMSGEEDSCWETWKSLSLLSKIFLSGTFVCFLGVAMFGSVTIIPQGIVLLAYSAFGVMVWRVFGMVIKMRIVCLSMFLFNIDFMIDICLLFVPRLTVKEKC